MYLYSYDNKRIFHDVHYEHPYLNESINQILDRCKRFTHKLIITNII